MHIIIIKKYSVQYLLLYVFCMEVCEDYCSSDSLCSLEESQHPHSSGSQHVCRSPDKHGGGGGFTQCTSDSVQ